MLRMFKRIPVDYIADVLLISAFLVWSTNLVAALLLLTVGASMTVYQIKRVLTNHRRHANTSNTSKRG